jgi:hypothetical protein
MENQYYFDRDRQQFRVIEIGDKVKWVSGNKIRRGIFKQVVNNTAEVITTFVEDQPINLKCFVPLTLIEFE